MVIEVRHYQTADGKTPIVDWLKEFRDLATRARIVARLDRLNAGLLGEWKIVGGGICELKVDLGPGYRIYYGKHGNTLILLLCAGDKGSQAKDTKRAHAYWKDYKARRREPPV